MHSAWGDDVAYLRFAQLPVLVAILVLPYWIPTIVAFVRHADRKAGIVLLNIFAGWTVLGWIGALIWACVAETEQQARLRESAYANMAAMQAPQTSLLDR